jgi:hypothetical protein
MKPILPKLSSRDQAARDNLKLLGATPERQPFYRQTKPRN